MQIVVRPCCGQLYNLFHACDPNASRIEPLIQSEFSQIPPCCIPRYSQFPLGDGESTLLGKIIIELIFENEFVFIVEYVHQHSKLFLNNNTRSSSLVNTSRPINENNSLNTDTIFANSN